LIFTTFGLIALLIVLGTLIEMASLHPPPWQTMEPGSTGLNLLKSFSLFSNGAALISTEQGGSGHLNCMNGMR
jgi:hypothetical protein